MGWASPPPLFECVCEIFSLRVRETFFCSQASVKSDRHSRIFIHFKDYNCLRKFTNGVCRGGEICFLRFWGMLCLLVNANFADFLPKPSRCHTKSSWKTIVTSKKKKLFSSRFLGNFGYESRKFSKKPIDVRPGKKFLAFLRFSPVPPPRRPWVPAKNNLPPLPHS